MPQSQNCTGLRLVVGLQGSKRFTSSRKTLKNIVIRGVEVEENRSRDLVKGGLERTHVEVLGGSGPAAALRETSSVGFSINLPLSFHSTTAALSFVETFVVETEAAAGRLMENPTDEVLERTEPTPLKTCHPSLSARSIKRSPEKVPEVSSWFDGGRATLGANCNPEPNTGTFTELNRLNALLAFRFAACR